MSGNESASLSYKKAHNKESKLINILFLSHDNGCRSQLAEGLVRAMKPVGVSVRSAGLVTAAVNPLVSSVMSDMCIDISQQYSKTVEISDFEAADIIVTVCEQADLRCPPTPAGKIKYYWPVSKPVAEGLEEEAALSVRACVENLRARLVHLFQMESISFEDDLLKKQKESSADKRCAQLI